MIGMMWFDNDPKTSSREKCLRAMYYYLKKYGSRPNLVIVHPSVAITEIENVTIKVSRSVMPNHFWIGMDTP